MTNPLVDLMKKVRLKIFAQPAAEAPATNATQLPSALDKRSGERLSKTVMPNATRVIAPQDPLSAASGNSAPPTAMTAIKTGPRMVSVGATQSARQKPDLPPAIALALEPKVERAISLQLSEILEQFPIGYVKSEESFDPTRRVLLKAVEIEKGMAQRNPSVALTSIYEQIPEIFLRSVPLNDKTRIPLPFEKVLDQFNRLQVRRDQARDNSVPQVDTPFLLVALEESEKFGTTIEPLQASALPPVKVEPATAEAFAAAEPEAAESLAGASPAMAENSLLESAAGAGAATAPRSAIPVPESRVTEQPPHHFTPARIPFHLPPKGTGAPASERVPASSGPPVLSPSIPPKSVPPKAPPKLEPLRNPYEDVPFDQLKRSPPTISPRMGGAERSTSEPTAEIKRPRRQRKINDAIGFEPLTPSLASPIAVPEKKPDEIITLSLRVLLQNLPAFQRQGDPTLAPEDAKINLPLSFITEQLATGRVALAPKVFLEAIPPDYRYLFHADEHETPVVLPLHEILQKVPANALQTRSDQEQLDTGEAIETPFSIQAEEDARRFSGEEPTVASVLEKSPKIDKEPAQKINAKEVVARATVLPGVNGCAITFADGLSLAGNLPLAIAADGLCAVAPTLLQRIDQHMLDTKLGPLSSMTLHGATSAVTFFLSGNICLSALHTTESLTAETRRQLGGLVKELSRTYSQPEISHVDH